MCTNGATYGLRGGQQRGDALLQRHTEGDARLTISMGCEHTCAAEAPFAKPRMMCLNAFVT